MVAGNVAEAKGLNGSSWALVGFFFGPIGLIGVAGMPDRRLRQYMRSIAIKLEAIEEKESVRLETTPNCASPYKQADLHICQRDGQRSAADNGSCV